MTEEQKIAELLKPRIEVINPWPGMECKVGDIINLPSSEWMYSKYQYCDEDYFAEWPNLFRLLQWWERREAGEMPEYMRYEVTGQIFRYSDHVREDGMIQIGLYSWGVRSCTPATLSDYNNFIQLQKEK